MIAMVDGVAKSEANVLSGDHHGRDATVHREL